MHFSLLVISNPNQARMTMAEVVRRYGENSEICEFDGIEYQMRGGILSVYGDRGFRTKVRHIDNSAPEPISNGSIHLVQTDQSLPAFKKYDFLAALVTPDLKWHNRFTDENWNAFVTDTLASVDPDCVATLYDCHR